MIGRRCERLWGSALAAACVLAAIPLGAGAVQTTVPTATVPVRALPGGVRSSATANIAQPFRGPTRNAIYGTIVALDGDTITLETRAGRRRRIDASPAVAAGFVSAPLYIGKLVVAEGLTRTDGVLTAARITRITRLDHTAPDR